MSNVVQQTQQDFWRPPVPSVETEIAVHAAVPVTVQACPRCGTEYLLGSRFCHTCGSHRPETVSAEARADAAVMARLWEQGVARIHSALRGFSWREISLPAWVRYLHFHEIQRRVGLSTASFIAFVIGIGCVAGALTVGLMTAKTFVDWQAIQFYRAEWLLAAVVAFVAGILLKKPTQS